MGSQFRRFVVVFFALSLFGIGDLARQAAAEVRPIDDARAAAAGLRKLTGKHITIYTDLPSDAEVDALPAAFDRAVPQWAAYFHVPEASSAKDSVADWHVTCFLIGDRGPFDALGLMPTGNDEFAHGIAYGAELWLYEQPTAYYRRHLLLHEGVHAFMAKFLGSCGPGWYMEGTAELLATHRLVATAPKRGQAPRFDTASRVETEFGSEPIPFLEVNIMPRDRREVPMLGRVKLIRDAVAEDRALGLEAVMQLDNRRQLQNESYAWCWAAAKWLDSHPRYCDRFRELYRHVQDPDFNDLMQREFADDWSDLAIEWQVYVATLDHGYDFERMAIEFQRGKSLGRERQAVTVAADRGWQSSGAWLEAGRHYLIKAEGRYEIAREAVDGRERVWRSEPGGVTIEYRGGFPLGMLLGAIDTRTSAAPSASKEQADDAGPAAREAGFAHPFAIGLRQTITPAESGTLYLRVNDSGGKLGDNRGQLSVVIEEVDRAGGESR